MTILVTGGAGYIGSATTEYLHARGEHVVVLDNLARGHRGAISDQIPLYLGEIGDCELVARIAKDHNLESCIHFAALTEVSESVIDPAKYFKNNVADGIKFFGALLKAGVKRLIFSSSAAIYGDLEQTPISEECRKWPKTPYGWSKLFMEQLLNDYDVAYGLKFVALRYFNAAGATENNGEDHRPESHLIPNALSAAQGHQDAVRVFGNNYPTPDGTAVRDYIHVADLADAHFKALQYLRQGGTSDSLNLGTGQGYSVLEVIERVREITGRDILVRMEAPRPGDPACLVANAERAKAVLGWNPTASDLHSIVRSAWEWRLRHPEGYAAD